MTELGIPATVSENVPSLQLGMAPVALDEWLTIDVRLSIFRSILREVISQLHLMAHRALVDKVLGKISLKLWLQAFVKESHLSFHLSVTHDPWVFTHLRSFQGGINKFFE